MFRPAASRRLGVALLLALPAVGSSQVVRGTARGVTGAPVPQVVVELVDSAGRIADRQLTSDSGAFRLAAKAAGPHVVRTLRIGFKPTLHAVLLRSGQLDLDLLLPDIQFVLDTVRTIARNTCTRIGADTAGALFDVWQQARAAISAADVTAHSQAFVATTISHARRLSADGKRVVERTIVVNEGLVNESWQSVPADSLRRAGYVVTDRENWTHYYAPGLDALLAEPFLADHCVRFAVPSPGRIGIEFEPTSDRRRVAEIRGTLWLDSASAELRSIEYSYVNITVEAQRFARGSAAFARLRNGSWVVTGWNLRMPVVEMVTGGQRFERAGRRVSEVRETGGTLALVVSGSDTLWAASPVYLVGRVVDSVSTRPLAGASISLRDTRVRSTSGMDGQFRIGPVLPGTYLLEIRTPSLDSVTAVYTRSLHVTSETEPPVVRVPTGSLLAASLCPRAVAGGIILGRVTSEVGMPWRVRVVAEWTIDASADALASARRWIETRTDSLGSYRICGLPTDRTVLVRALTDSAVADPVPVSFVKRVERAHFALKPGQPTAVFAAHVYVDSSRRPLSGVTVAVPSLDRSAETDSAGHVRMAGLPPGRHDIQVRRLGYGPLVAEVEFGPNETVTRQIFLARLTLLDSVEVAATRIEPFMRVFAEHKALGLGNFLTRDDLAKLEGRTFESVVLQFPKVRVRTVFGGKAFLETTNTGQNSLRTYAASLGQKVSSCYVHVWVDGVRVYGGRDGEPRFDIRSVANDRLEAVEFYAGPAQIPPRYSALNATCGVLVLWTRRSP